MLALVLNPAVLCVLVWLVARGTAEAEFGKMFFIALAVGLIGEIAGAAFGGWHVFLLALVPVLALLAYLLMKYCSLTLQQALIVTGLYFAYQVGFMILMEVLLR